MIGRKELLTYIGLGIFGILGPYLFPNYTLSIAYLWMMIMMAQTWDILGGQMGYNSLGNITFFGVGMYASAVIQVAIFYEPGVAAYTSAMGAVKPEFTQQQYFWGIFLGIFGGALAALALCMIFSSFMFGLRGPYFAIGSLGLAIAAAEVGVGLAIVLLIFRNRNSVDLSSMDSMKG